MAVAVKGVRRDAAIVSGAAPVHDLLHHPIPFVVLANVEEAVPTLFEFKSVNKPDADFVQRFLDRSVDLLLAFMG